MASLPSITPLNGYVSYLRWKESMLLLLNTAGVAHILSEDPPSSSGDGASPEAAGRRRPGNGRATTRTGRALWRAVARTYDVGTPPSVSWRKFTEFEFRLDGCGGGGAPPPSFLEQLAHAEALGLAGQPSSHRDLVDYTLGKKLPPDVASRATVALSDGSVSVSVDKA
ncbi:hypothetical protein SETIT_6G149700v2 [Setaria italica]|uniref:Uncharacterized protein n=1 Tax=Setaria italica TaxID=4555 RepID=A0A368RLL9_SETIT|nr:hypothetical protein SETIT_6G149700v2 [Setaria italica]